MVDTDANPRLGRYVETSFAGETARAFVPPALPPQPRIDTTCLLEQLSLAERALGRLDGITLLLPSQELFLYMYVRKEAVLSSQIEGTQSTLSGLLRFEISAKSGHPIDDIREVSNYVDAMEYGLERLASLPLSLRLIREMHARLMRSGRGETKNPGEFRRSQNWIGGSRPGQAAYVPPPTTELDACLDELEKFMHEEDSKIPTLIKAGMIHVQFETIHPFLDGNGRIGRLLITLYLCLNGVLRKPLLYLSLYLKTHRADYYRLLQEVRERGEWEAWLKFFLIGIADTANQAFDAATRIIELFNADRAQIAAERKRANSTLRVHDLFQQNPYLTANLIIEKTRLTHPAVNAAIADLVRLGIVEEVTGRRRGRVFGYTGYLAILDEGTEVLPDESE